MPARRRRRPFSGPGATEDRTSSSEPTSRCPSAEQAYGMRQLMRRCGHFALSWDSCFQSADCRAGVHCLVSQGKYKYSPLNQPSTNIAASVVHFVSLEENISTQH